MLRCAVLRLAENLRAKGVKQVERYAKINEKAKEVGLDDPRKDKTSHFTLRLVFCKKCTALLCTRSRGCSRVLLLFVQRGAATMDPAE